jgi:hypothetical protein
VGQDTLLAPAGQHALSRRAGLVAPPRRQESSSRSGPRILRSEIFSWPPSNQEDAGRGWSITFNSSPNANALSHQRELWQPILNSRVIYSGAT